MTDTTHVKIHDSEYTGPCNFHVAKHNDEVHVELTYPKWTDADTTAEGGCRHVYVNQESVRASDGVRLHYDYERDGFVVEQPNPRLVCVGKNSYETPENWIEVGFFKSWAKNVRPGCDFTQEDYERADADFAAKVK